MSLAVGETFAVDWTRTDYSHQWFPDDRRDHVLKATDSDSGDCTADAAGCADATRTTYTALARGTATVTWRFESCGHAGPQPCVALTTKTISVTVR
ncbi:hypothetical protein ACFC1R_15335 [Kitasatospora sp. NPDC056138]|uniref:hypothetical protein n=1 Tax=Kitasatospora sp. NPDC056138 TaxID=3345724 RepID=UPI0035DDF674